MHSNSIECRKCGVRKPKSEFATYDNGKAKGVRKTCKDCVKLEPRFPRSGRKQREYGSEATCCECKTVYPIEHFGFQTSTTNGRRYLLAICKACKARRRRERYATPQGRESIRHHAMKGKYGIGMDEYRRKHDEQSGLCAVCGKPETARRKGKLLMLAVDHSHVTSQVRDLLCNRCNKGLGCFFDDPQILRQAADYLRRHST